MLEPGNVSASFLRALSVPCPDTPYTVDAVYVTSQGKIGVTGFFVGWADNANKIVLYTNQAYCAIEKWNSPTSYSANYADLDGSNSQAIWQVAGGPLYIRITDDGSYRNVYTSCNGWTWYTTYAAKAHTDFLTPTKLVWGLISFSTRMPSMATLLSWHEF